MIIPVRMFKTYNFSYITMMIPVLMFTGDASIIDAMKFSNTIQLSPF